MNYKLLNSKVPALFSKEIRTSANASIYNWGEFSDIIWIYLGLLSFLS